MQKFPAPTTNQICANPTNDPMDPDLIQPRNIYINDDTSSSSPHCMAKFGLVEGIILMDTGAAASVMQEIILDGLPEESIICTQPPTVEFCTAPNGNKMAAKSLTTLEFKLNGWTFQHPFLILRDLKKPIILGSDFFCQKNAEIYYQNNQPYKIVLDSKYRIPLFRADRITERKYPDVPSIQYGPGYMPAGAQRLQKFNNNELTPGHRANSSRRYQEQRQSSNEGFYNLQNDAIVRRMPSEPVQCQYPDRPITALQPDSVHTSDAWN